MFVHDSGTVLQCAGNLEQLFLQDRHQSCNLAPTWGGARLPAILQSWSQMVNRSSSKWAGWDKLGKMLKIARLLAILACPPRFPRLQNHQDLVSN